MVMISTTGALSDMADPVLRDRLPYLWRCIENAHYSYLETDDSPEKLQQRKKLEGYIMEYLSLVPHECKFGLSETSKVFQRTINELPEFSAYRAGLGWAALARYASNLLAQPWRKEYKTIRLFCGYYKHEVEANMVGAELLLRQLGYKPDGPSRLSLDGPICPDMVAAISRDALIAYVECQIMTHVWEAVWGNGGRVSWAEVARERAHRVGDITATAARLTSQCTTEAFVPVHNYVHDSGIYTNLMYNSADPYNNDRQIEDIRPGARYHVSPDISPPDEPIVPMILAQPYALPTAHQMPPHLLYPMQPQHIHPEVTVPHTTHYNPVPMMTPYAAMPYYYQPVQAPYMIPTPVFAPIRHATTASVNGYPPVPQYRSLTVPTAQLIELDAPSVYENGGKRETRSHRDIEGDRSILKKNHLESSCKASSKSCVSDLSSTSIPRSDTQPTLSKAREDGMGTYESWDYVFKNLSSKDDENTRNRHSPSFDRDSRTLDRLDREERRSRYQPTTLDLEDGLQALSIDRSYDDDMYRTAKVNENLMRIKQESELKKAKQLAKRQSLDEKKHRKQFTNENSCNNESNIAVNGKVAPDKVRLLSKKDVKDRKEILKQQNSFNGVTDGGADLRKVKKISKAGSTEMDKFNVKQQFVQNGIHNTGNISRSVPGSSNYQAIANPNYDLKAHLVVSLDETDSIRRTSPKHNQSNGDYERPSSRNSSRQNGIATSEVAYCNGDAQKTESNKKRDKWECGTCTYINKVAYSACEMCGKSRVTGPEILPLTSGGRECPACTLVNNRSAIVCDACGTSLDHCPTYI